MRIDTKGRGENGALSLGIQTNPDRVEQAITDKCIGWAPTKAKSYTVTSYGHTDYHGRAVKAPTGYGTLEVAYFTTRNEGTVRL